MDPSLKVRPEAELCRHSPESESWTVIFSTAEKIGSAPPYPERVRLIETGGGTEGESRSVLRDGLTWLAQNNIQSVLCEGGGRLAAALLSENLVDEIFWIIAPKFLIDSQAIPALDGQQASDISACLKFKSFSYRQLGPDMLVRGLL